MSESVKAASIWCMLLLVAAGRSNSADKKYVSPDHSFALTVPAGYGIHSGKEKPSRSYIAVCHAESLVCITFPPGRFTGTTFGDASVEFTILAANTEQACTSDPEFRIDAKNPSRKIDGLRFLHFIGGGAAANNTIEIHRFRAYRDGRCYELALHVTFTNSGAYDPGTIKEFTRHDNERVIGELKRILVSCRFLK